MTVSEEHLQGIVRAVKSAGCKYADYWVKGSEYTSKHTAMIEVADAFVIIFPENKFKHPVHSLPAGTRKELQLALKLGKTIFLGYKLTDSTTYKIYSTDFNASGVTLEGIGGSTKNFEEYCKNGADAERARVQNIYGEAKSSEDLYSSTYWHKYLLNFSLDGMVSAPHSSKGYNLSTVVAIASHLGPAFNIGNLDSYFPVYAGANVTLLNKKEQAMRVQMSKGGQGFALTLGGSVQKDKPKEVLVAEYPFTPKDSYVLGYDPYKETDAPKGMIKVPFEDRGGTQEDVRRKREAFERTNKPWHQDREAIKASNLAMAYGNSNLARSINQASGRALRDEDYMMKQALAYQQSLGIAIVDHPHRIMAFESTQESVLKKWQELYRQTMTEISKLTEKELRENFVTISANGHEDHFIDKRVLLMLA